MNLLTVKEVKEIIMANHFDFDMARAIEAAIMAKFEVVAWAHINYEDGGQADCLQSYADAYCREPLYALKEKTSPKPVR